MEVHLLSHTLNPEKVIYSAARQCYSQLSADRIYFDREKVSRKKLKKFLRDLMKRGHLSPFEHVSFVFSINGVSRVCTHQLVRHRLASYSQQSQRYVSIKNFDCVIPPVIKKNKKAKEIFMNTVETVKSNYKDLQEVLIKEGKLTREEINQDLRFIIPQAIETKIVVSMNIRELFHFFSERLCLRAQWEIRAVAVKMFSLCKKVMPEVFSSAGPKCKMIGYCPENNVRCALYKKFLPTA